MISAVPKVGTIAQNPGKILLSLSVKNDIDIRIIPAIGTNSSKAFRHICSGGAKDVFRNCRATYAPIKNSQKRVNGRKNAVLGW